MPKPLGNSYKIEILPGQSRIAIEVFLKEEPEPILISGTYKTQGEKFEIENLTCSKAWINEILSYYMEKQSSLGVTLEKFLAEMVSKFL